MRVRTLSTKTWRALMSPCVCAYVDICTILQCLGLAPEVVDTCFKGTASRIGGVGFSQLAKDTMALHKAAYQVGTRV